MSKENPRIIWSFTEEDLACYYTKAACPKCQTGEDCAEADCGEPCGHEAGGAYWALPEARQDELYALATGAMDNSTVPEAGSDVLAAVAERAVGP